MFTIHTPKPTTWYALAFDKCPKCEADVEQGEVVTNKDAFVTRDEACGTTGASVDRMQALVGANAISLVMDFTTGEVLVYRDQLDTIKYHAQEFLKGLYFGEPHGKEVTK